MNIFLLILLFFLAIVLKIKVYLKKNQHLFRYNMISKKIIVLITTTIFSLGTTYILVAAQTTLEQGSSIFTTRRTGSAITGNVVGVSGSGSSATVTLTQGFAQFITGNAGGGTTLTQAVTKFTTAQAVGMAGLAQEFFSWLLSVFG